MRKAKGMFFKQIGVLALVLALLLGCAPENTLTAKAEAAAETLAKVSDPATVNDWTNVFQNNTANVGGVWTDKSVFTSANDYISATGKPENSAAQSALELDNDGSFLVALSAISSTKTITGYSTKPTDTMLILDLSGSMSGSVSAMVTAANKAVGDLLALNSHNRVGVVLFSGNSNFGNSATNTATVLMPLNRYSTTSTVRLNGQTVPLYIQANNNEYVSVAEGVSPRTGLSAGKGTSGGTYTQNGIYQAMQQLVNANGKVIPEGSVQAGMTRIPIMVLMSDGEPTAATKSYTNINTSDVGTGETGKGYQSDISFLTQLTAAYAKREIETAYGIDSRFYTLGYSVANLPAAICVLDPEYSRTPSRVNELWSRFNSTNAGGTFSINAENHQGKTVTKHTDAVNKYTKTLADYRYYTDRYFPANRSSDLSAAFQSIVDEIVLQSMYYPTKVDGSVHSDGYVEFHDYIGANMEVKGIKGIQLGANLYTGQNFARQLLAGSGSVENPSDLGDNIVWAVRERLQLEDIAGGKTAVEQARDIISTAYRNGQLAYNAGTGEFSNFIGWYSDANGKYLASWDGGEMTGVSGAAYAVKSYFFLDAVGSGHRETDTLYAMVQVRTHLDTRVEEVHGKLPASLIPLVQYTIQLQGSDPTAVTGVTKEGTDFPSRLIYEVGLSSQIDLLDIENTAPRPDDLNTDYTKPGDHGNKDSANGTYVFYTNEWQRNVEADDDTHLPDLNEYNTHVFFRPSEENERYYYHEDMPVYVQNGNGYSLYTGGAAPSGDAYYRLRYIYTVGSDSVTPEYEPIPASALQSAKRTENGWVVPMGTVFRMQTRAAVSKTSNPTGTLGHSEAIVFHNRYTAKPATNVKIEGVKTLNGDLTLQAGMFTFELYQTDDTFAATGTPVRTTKNLAPVGDSADFAFAMSYDEPGTYYYVVKEQIPTGDDGITYDTTEHHITVTVTDDGKGQLVAAVDKAKSTVAFTNSYDADPVEVAAITGRKTLTGDELKAGDFTFELWQAHKEAGGTGRVFAVGNQPVQKVSNDGNGAFRFEPLTFDTVGDYWYIVRETVGSEPGMDYDTTCHYVEINVKDTLKGQLTADVKINGSATGAITFANIYTKPEDVNALIMLQKEVVGSNAATVGLKDFAFVLSYGNETLLEALSDVNGVAGFQLIFDADDVDKTFEFKVSEQQGLIPGMTYDPMVYTVVIHVGQNADGSLALTINGQSTDTVNLRFTNIYTGVVPPTTGDRFPMMLMSGMILISVAGIAAILLNMRRKHS